MPIKNDISPNARETLENCLKTLDKYKNLEGVKKYLEDMKYHLNYYSGSTQIEYGYPPLPPIAEIPTDDLLKEIKRRIEYHGGPIA